MAVNVKRIAKNSIYLYIRMVVTMLITIFSSRVVLQTLGIEGFGTYNIIYGIVTLFLFIQSSLNTATLRFISSSIAIYCEKEQIIIFISSFQVTIALSLLILLLLETVGLYLINNVLNIGVEYRGISNFCYQVCVLSYVFQMLRIPFTSLVVSHERMSFYAIISIVESICKLLAAFLLFFSGDSKLVDYCVYISASTFICTAITIIYSVISFSTCRIYIMRNDVDYLKKILVFSGWTTLSSFSNSVSQQGGNILMNIYSGVIANAAWGIAHQVNTAFAALAASLQTAFSPQINKSYAERDIKGLMTLVSRSSSIAYYMVLFLSVPIICNVDFILDFWLVTPPDFLGKFCVFIILFQMIDTMQAPFNTLIFATGKVKFYNIWLSLILILNVIISAILLSKGYSPVFVPITMFVLNGITGLLRFLHINLYLRIEIKDYFTNYLSRMLLVTIVCFVTSYVFIFVCDKLMLGGLIKFLISAILTIFIVFLLGFSKADKHKLLGILKG